MSTLWVMIFSNVLIATLLAVAAATLGRIWKNPAALHLIWIAVLVKLFTPAIVTIDLPVRFDNTVVSARLPASPSEDIAACVNSVRQTKIDRATPALQPAFVAENIQAVPRQLATPAASTADSAGRSLIALWIGGSIVIGTMSIIRIRRFALFTRQLDPAPHSVQLLTTQIATRLGIQRVPTVWMTEQVLPPLVWSIGTAPKIILPTALFAQLSLPAQASVLAHELVHIRRGDHLVRLLEAAAITVFWWNPVVWWACWQIRELEEQCCDSRVLELNPSDARIYALTLIDTADFLSKQPRVSLPLPTALQSAQSLASRIRHLADRQANRLNVRSAICIAPLMIVPIFTTFAADSDSKIADKKDEPAGPVAILRGYVDDEAGHPLADTRIKVVLSQFDMRFLHFNRFAEPRTEPIVLEATTGENGQFQLKVMGIKQPTKISIDALKPGYRRLSGTPMQGGDMQDVELMAGAIRQIKLTMKPALYVSGVVVDQYGKPIPDVQVHAMANTPVASGGVDWSVTNAEGKFELFNYSVERFKLGAAEAKGVVDFFHPHYLEHTIADVYALDVDQDHPLRIVLPTGRRISGTVIDAAGKRVANVMVKVNSLEEDGRKAILTDANGHFDLRGLREGKSKLGVLAWDINQKYRQSLEITQDLKEMEIRLQPISLPEKIKTVEVLGMQLTDLTGELAEAFDFDWPDARAALIIDPGREFERLKIGTMQKGFHFFMVGNNEVGSVREFVQQLIREAGDLDKDEYSIRVVYGMSNVDFDGTNTQHMKLRRDDIVKLKALLEQLPEKK